MEPEPGLGLKVMLDRLGVRAFDRHLKYTGPCTVCNCPVGITTVSSSHGNGGGGGGGGGGTAAAASSDGAGAAAAEGTRPSGMCEALDATTLPILLPTATATATATSTALPSQNTAAYTAAASSDGDGGIAVPVAGSAGASTEASVSDTAIDAAAEGGVVLLAYKYTALANPRAVQEWQVALCNRLNLKGKIRVGVEGINLTCAGTVRDTTAYIAEVCSSPYFGGLMHPADFKRSTYVRTPPAVAAARAHGAASSVQARIAAHTLQTAAVTPSPSAAATPPPTASGTVAAGVEPFDELKVSR